MEVLKDKRQLLLTAFLVYATWAGMQNAHYTFGPYLSPFYSPEIFGASPHAWFGPKPEWWPALIPFSPALIILPVPALFRFSCYYYRGAYYKAFWQDPPGCTVGEPRVKYTGERFFPVSMQNMHRYGLLLSAIFLVILIGDVLEAFWFTNPATGRASFGIGLGTLVMLANVILLGGYTLGCHSTRHVLGGRVDRLSDSKARKVAYDCSSCLNRQHMRWAWCSLISVGFTDLYIRMCSMGVWHDLRLFG